MDGVDLVNNDSLMIYNLISTIEESYTHYLFELEERHMLTADYKRHCIDDQPNTRRFTCIFSMLQMEKHFKLTPSTVILAVNYCDRFLSSRLHDPNRRRISWYRWCVLLAAKIDNLPSRQSAVTLLSILNPANPIDRERVLETEIMVLKELNWELRSVTPIDFIPYFISKLPQPPPTIDLKSLAGMASDLILGTTTIPSFLRYPPSVIGAAAVLWANLPYHLKITTCYDHGSLHESVDQEARGDVTEIWTCLFLTDSTSNLTDMHESFVYEVADFTSDLTVMCFLNEH